MDIEANVGTYLASCRPDTRYASFDYCFNYFQEAREQGRVAELIDGENLQISCLQLGFYLASWGMLRGSAELLRHSVRSLIPAVSLITTAPPAVWAADADDYSDGVIQELVRFADELRRDLPGYASDILLTKIMLGVFGCVPAFDSYFKAGLKAGAGVSSFGPRSLRSLAEFYARNRELIERHRVPTLDFATGRSTGRTYTRAKVIDMVFWIEGGGSLAATDRSAALVKDRG